MNFTSYILGRIPSTLVKDLAAAFDHLPADVIDYKRNGFLSRFRSFGSFSWVDEQFQPDAGVLELFNKKKDFHTANLGQPAALQEQTLASDVLPRLLTTIVAHSPLKDAADYAFGVNLIRVRANDDFMGAPAPGLHQDGYDFSCHLNIARQNVSGGASIIAQTRAPETTILECELKPGDFIFFNDQQLFHTASPVAPRCAGYETFRDMIIIDIVQKRPQRAGTQRAALT